MPWSKGIRERTNAGCFRNVALLGSGSLHPASPSCMVMLLESRLKSPSNVIVGIGFIQHITATSDAIWIWEAMVMMLVALSIHKDLGVLIHGGDGADTFNEIGDDGNA